MNAHNLRCGTGEFLIVEDGPVEAPALLFSNSLSSNLTMWDAQVAALAGRFRIIRYNGRGQPGSVVTPGPYTMAQLGQDAVAILDALGIATARFCGLSMGGMVGLWLLTHASARIERAVLANTAAYMGPASLWEGRITLARQGGIAATVEPTVTRWFRPEVHRADPALIERMRAMIRTTPLDGYVACCEAIRDMDQRQSMRAIARPTLVIVGEHDVATTPADGQVIHEAITGSKLVSLPAGHLSAVEQPAAFTDAVAAFLGTP
jgi:3-oxoadipate enol-lactonase